jgi:hypothetical protein
MNESANFNQEESKEGMVNRSEFILKSAMAGSECNDWLCFT